MSEQEGFLMDVNTAALFFRACRWFKIDGRQERIALMREIVRRGKAKYLRNAGEALAGKRVLVVKGLKRSNANEN